MNSAFASARGWAIAIGVCLLGTACAAGPSLDAVPSAPPATASATATVAPTPLPSVATPTQEVTATPVPTATPVLPPWAPVPGTTWQWQLTGEVDTGVDVEMYDVDLFDVSDAALTELRADNRTVICYFSAGSFEDWRADAADFPPEIIGEDNGWPGERWLDVRALETLEPIMSARLDLAVQRGCDGVEPDNIDAYQNASGFEISADDQVAYAQWLSAEAHRRGLSIGMKNAVSLIADLEPVFDWALNERCMEFLECATLLPFIDAGKAVFHVEYRGELAWCPTALELGLSSLEKDEDLGPEYRPCVPAG